MKKIVIAPQGFKGTFSPKQAAAIFATRAKKLYPDAEIVLLPVADGGDGTLEVLAEKTVEIEVSGPFGEPIFAPLGITGNVAIIELAKIAGLALVPENERNPLKTTTCGVGEAIVAAIDLGFREIWVGLGGSATCDGGVDAALIAAKDPRMNDCRIIALCDVDSTLFEAKKYLRQKGADEKMQEQLIKRLEMLEALFPGAADWPGGGAAGGAGAGLAIFLGAVLVPGAEWVLEKIGFADAIADADLVITGEGELNLQTLAGKAPAAVARAARAKGIKTLAVVGTSQDIEAEKLFDRVITIEHFLTGLW